MTSNTRRSRVPDIPDIEPELHGMLDTLDKRQQRFGELEDLSGSATTADIIAKINAMLQTHRTR